ncbi:Hypothetical protein DPCES_1387 [Desulfitobacterium hafniense]|uniref:Uncharacterized protein n=1 Tax=Desulfitobacterium hafniense TaxID=49338 RepID=A0A098AXB0_DESHA|nr:hypothetical protein [Desulfitobacterium hafniense]CDX01274.1 Hypothetical protein DPCES_1387 [Desulfitobacterium hafniense]
MRIKKIKISSGRVLVNYEKRSKSGLWDEYSFNCSEEPRPELKEAMTALAPHVVDMCELPEEYLSKIEVKSVSFSYGGENATMGATISGQMKLENSYCGLNLNTPHKASEMYNPSSEPDEMQLLTEECIDDLEVLCEEVKLFIDGERAQQRLFAVG